MGTHYITYNFDVTADCNTFLPMMILYNQRKLSGFAFSVPTFTLGPK